MKTVIRMTIRTVVGMALLLSTVAANAQVEHQMRITVPFSFVAGERISPAGDYRIIIDRERNLVTLTKPGTKPTFVLTTEAFHSADEKSFLRFRQYDGQWFLQEVTFEGIALKMPRGKVERSILASIKPSDRPAMVADLAAH
jgi:hypothetical protein